jgi:hypothetical protein
MASLDMNFGYFMSSSSAASGAQAGSIQCSSNVTDCSNDSLGNHVMATIDSTSPIVQWSII